MEEILKQLKNVNQIIKSFNNSSIVNEDTRYYFQFCNTYYCEKQTVLNMFKHHVENMSLRFMSFDGNSNYQGKTDTSFDNFLINFLKNNIGNDCVLYLFQHSIIFENIRRHYQMHTLKYKNIFEIDSN